VPHNALQGRSRGFKVESVHCIASEQVGCASLDCIETILLAGRPGLYKDAFDRCRTFYLAYDIYILINCIKSFGFTALVEIFNSL
jgi:hypothetical protein